MADSVTFFPGLESCYSPFSCSDIMNQIGCVFAEYGLFKPTIFIQNLIYINFGINLTQLCINFLIQEHQIELLWV